MIEVLDTFIGLVTIYLVLSLIVTALGEGVSVHLNLKGRTVRDIVDNLLGLEWGEKLLRRPDMLRLYKPTRFVWGRSGIVMGEEGDGGEVRARKYRLPSYLPAEVFADTLLDCVMAEEKVPWTGHPGRLDVALRKIEGPVGGKLLSLWRQAGFDIAAFKAQIVAWFDQTAQRSHGWYKRKLGLGIFLCAALVSTVLNADTVHMFKVLTENQTLREQLFEEATSLIARYDQRQAGEESAAREDEAAALQTVVCEKAGVDPCDAQGMARALLPDILPLLGWEAADSALSGLCWPLAAGCEWAVGSMRAALLKAAGLFLTTVAISLGAPFWFDLLHKVIEVRGAIRRSAATTETVTTTDGASVPATAAPPLARSRVRAAAATQEELSLLSGFRAHRFGYDPLNLYWSARLSALAYDSRGEVEAQLDEFGAEGTLVSHRDARGRIDSQCLVACTPRAAFLSFRGTEQKLEDWLTDADLALVRHSLYDCLVHTGFNRALTGGDDGQHCWASVLDELRRMSVLERGLPIWLSGHSLGGALAVLAALSLEQSLPAGSASVIGGIHTFGQPRIGDRAFTDIIDRRFPQKYFRSINNRDIVPRIPLPRTPAFWLKDEQGNMPNFEYEHAGRVLYFNDLGHAVMDPPLWYRKLDVMEFSVEELKAKLAETAGDHAIRGYLALHQALVLAPVAEETAA